MYAPSKENSNELTGMQYAPNLDWIDSFDPGFSLKPSGNILNQDKYETLGIHVVFSFQKDHLI
jgi:hypothetical protein